MMKPTIHLNGTSKKELLDQQLLVIRALRKAVEAMRAAAPNGRDYYPQSSHATQDAISEHNLRIHAIECIIQSHEAIAMHISDQGK